jgi:CcmD family protein
MIILLRRVRPVLVAVGGLMLATVARLGAQGEEGFQPVGPGDIISENLPATPFVFAAYAAVWIALLIYVISLWRRLTRVERELAEVTSRLESKSS